MKTDTAKVALQDIGLKEAPVEEYDSFRLSLGIPDGSRDMLVEKSILLESNLRNSMVLIGIRVLYGTGG